MIQRLDELPPLYAVGSAPLTQGQRVESLRGGAAPAYAVYLRAPGIARQLIQSGFSSKREAGEWARRLNANTSLRQPSNTKKKAATSRKR